MINILKYRKKVYQVLEEQQFVLDDKDKEVVEKRISNGRRYFFLVAKRKEGELLVERFIKIPENNTKKLLLPFQRQIEFAIYIKNNNVLNTRGVVSYNVDPKKGTPFVIMETLPAGVDKIGFIEGNKGVELLGKEEAQKTVEQLMRFHSIEINSLPGNLKGVLKKYPGDYSSLKRQVLKYMNKKVKPLGGKKSEYHFKVLERNLGINDLKKKVNNLLAGYKSIIESKENKVYSLVHGDMAPNNLYVFDSHDVELLDLEWVGEFKNKAIAMILDFGNLRARSWKNKNFRIELDNALIEEYAKSGNEELGKIIVKLATLRSCIQLSSFFENYDWKKQELSDEKIRREQTEGDLKFIF